MEQENHQMEKPVGKYAKYGHQMQM